ACPRRERRGETVFVEQREVEPREAEATREEASVVAHPGAAVPGGVQREPDRARVRVDAQARTSAARSCGIPKQHGSAPKDRLPDGAMLAGVRLVAAEVVALEGAEDLGERGLDVGCIEIPTSVGNTDARG